MLDLQPRAQAFARPRDILAILAARRGVLVTVTGVSGPATRRMGAQMAVLENGERWGAISSGCVEAAIAAEALAALAAGQARLVRFGAGSRYIDIRLPCGGAIELLFTPAPDPAALGRAVALLDARRPVALRLGLAGEVTVSAELQRPDWAGDMFVAAWRPGLKLQIFGDGDEAIALARLALAHGAAVELCMTRHDAALRAAAADLDARIVPTPAAGARRACSADAWTAVACLFHDHDWEAAILPAAARTPAFWIGAMGSGRTQAARCERLAAAGLAPEEVARVRGPIGLIPSSRDPATLALSVLAETVATAEAQAR